ncbi:MAG TPA: HAMP domain-containing sensor histidine kinase [Ktedonobacterales bacterium]|nr:HAMP domain-containing sensor histidine kinase [Ktedonobacterales bacterium]
MTLRIRRNQFRGSVSPVSPSASFAGLLPGHAKALCSFFSRSASGKTGDTFFARFSPRAAAPVTSSEPPRGASWVWHDALLLGAFVVAALITIYQLIACLLRPLWLDPATDWLRATLAWPEMLLMVLASLWLTRTRRPGRISWWMFSIALFFYALAQTSWAIWDQLVYDGKVPFPYWDDLFYLLQYPCFFFALALLPGARHPGQPGMSRVKVIVDSLLLTAAGTALSWYFLLAPIYMLSTESPSGKLVGLAYPAGDLVLLVGLSIVLMRWRHQIAERLSMQFLIAAVILLMIADSWYAYLNLVGQFESGDPPDVFWVASYLAFALAGLVELRAARYHYAPPAEQDTDETLPQARLSSGVGRRARYFLPFVAAFLASIAIVGRALMVSDNRLSLLAPLGVSLGLLILVMIRQGITSLENERLLQEQEAAYANDLALREAARQMDEFLGIASHELKTPLTTIMLGLQMIQRRLQRLAGNAEAGGKAGGEVASCQSILDYTFHHGRRLSRLVNDLLDTSRIRQGQLPLQQRPTELIAVVEAAVEEQRQAAPERCILLRLPAQPSVCVFADADRIGQVVTNYLTNALKYAPPGPPISVGIRTECEHARVWVSDQGPGLSPAGQEQVWERFHRIPGIEAQTDSGIGLGLGLHISKTIIEHHGGQVGVQSAPGAGSTFWFTLPLSSETCQSIPP